LRWTQLICLLGPSIHSSLVEQYKTSYFNQKDLRKRCRFSLLPWNKSYPVGAIQMAYSSELDVLIIRNIIEKQSWRWFAALSFGCDDVRRKQKKRLVGTNERIESNRIESPSINQL